MCLGVETTSHVMWAQSCTEIRKNSNTNTDFRNRSKVFSILKFEAGSLRCGQSRGRGRLRVEVDEEEWERRAKSGGDG